MTERPKCNCRGVVAPGGICGYVTVGGEKCAAPAEYQCEHKEGAASAKQLEHCTCQTKCGDCQGIYEGTNAPCCSHRNPLYNRSRYKRVESWKSTSADDLKVTLAGLVNSDPEDAAEVCLFALIIGGVKGKTHRKHIAAALRAASKQLERCRMYAANGERSQIVRIMLADILAQAERGELDPEQIELWVTQQRKRLTAILSAARANWVEEVYEI